MLRAVALALLFVVAVNVSPAHAQETAPPSPQNAQAAPQTPPATQDQAGPDSASSDPSAAAAQTGADGALPPTDQPPGSDLPEKLTTWLGPTFTNTPMLGWITLLVGVLLGVIGGKIVQSLLRNVGDRFIRHGWQARGSILHYAASPTSLAILGLGLTIGIQGLVLSETVRPVALKLIGLIYVLAIAWFLYNLVDIIELAIRRITADNTIIALIRKALRIFVLVIFALFIAENIFGADITAWLAGLGLAGLAVSLAAQGPIKNIFGSITVVLDRPFGLGDAIKFRGVAGSVETMGFRSTKIRTPEGHLVTIPNAMLIDDMVENITARKSFRRLLDVTITYDTPPEKIEQAVQIIRDLLAEPFMAETFDMKNFPPRVHFNNFNAESLNINVVYWYQLNGEGRDWWAFQAQTQQFNLRLLRAFNEAGIEFAFPTRTLFLAGDQKRELALRMLTDNAANRNGM